MADQEKERGVWISRSPRAAFAGEVVVVLGDGQAAPLTAANVSETGMLLAAPVVAQPGPAVGENLQLIFDLPRLDAALQVRARVVRRDELKDALLLGVAFEHLAPSARRSLRTYVFTGQGKVVDYSPLEPDNPFEGGKPSEGEN